MARERHYIFSDQLPPTTQDLLFLEGYKSTLHLRNGKSVEFRPLLPSDEFAYRNFFYSFQEKTIYNRFFYKITLFTHKLAQEQWAILDYRKNLSIIGLTQEGGRQEIVAIGTYALTEDDRADVAFVVREDFQGLGIAGYLLQRLRVIAEQNGIRGFSADVLAENHSMLRVFQKHYPNARIAASGGPDLRIVMDFGDAAVAPDGARPES